MRPLLLAWAVPVLWGAPLVAAAAKPLTLTPLDREARAQAIAPIAELRHDVQEHPDDRTKRVALVRGLLRARDLDGALVEAKAWRARDAYNLVAVRALGDVHMERGEKDRAERVYSAIVELVPGDADAQRSLATVLKAQGDLEGAEARLRAAAEGRPDDARVLFELADVEQRLGKKESAEARFVRILEAPDTDDTLRHPAKLRLAQLLAERRRAPGADREALDRRIEALEVPGGLENDIHVYLTWDTDRTDVDLWVKTPSGEEVGYSHKHAKTGEALYGDVTTGYGPESFTAKDASPGDYVVRVNYFGGRAGAFPEARGEVVIVLDEGRPTEQRHVLPYRLFAEKESVDVARVRVGGAR